MGIYSSLITNGVKRISMTEDENNLFVLAFSPSVQSTYIANTLDLKK